MIDHVTIPVKNLSQSKKFYEQIFKPLGYKISFGREGEMWAFDIGNGALFEIYQYQGKQEITPCHVAFRVKTHKEVEEFYQSAMLAGAQDNGSPGFRPQYSKNYFACFVYDPDMYNIEAMCNEL